ncbi:fungal-specific transcription factor domain-containing protein [Xylaria grammica]|nr:fungal-specific transcription factor domain-containing protein [Xylaria grammica]
MSSMIQAYFAKTGHSPPFIHEESFLRSYHKMKMSNFGKVRRTWLGLLNIVFAMATTLSNTQHVSSEERIEESESRKNISIELVIAVQYLLILGQYLRGTKKSVQTWTLYGLAITVAFQLGLQSPKTNRGFRPLECEIRNRVWFGCILLDRKLSMIFGRPAIIPQSYVKLSLPSTSVHLVGNRNENATGPYLDAMYFTATIKLYEVMYRIIDECYGQNLGLGDSPGDTETISLVLGLSVRSIPLESRDMGALGQEDAIPGRLRMVLSLRYHNLRILLHRPVLERFLGECGDRIRTGDGRGFLRRVGIDSVETCVNSAMIIISIVRSIVSSTGWRRDLLGAWNFSLFYTFNAALVIFAAHHLSHNESKHGAHQDVLLWGFTDVSLPYFNMAITALQGLDPGNPVVERCVNHLSHLAGGLGGAGKSTGNDSVGRAMLQPYRELGTAYQDSSVEVSTEREQGAEQYTAASDHDQLNPRSTYQPLGLPGVETDCDEFMLDTDFYLFADNRLGMAG